MNRLHLDFSLTTESERLSFTQTYLDSPEFQKKPVTATEAEKIADYILWGTTPSDYNVELKTKWTRADNQSLDALIESPTFQESQISMVSPSRALIRKEKFSRSRTRKEAPVDLLPSFETLWRKIDETELLINYYELIQGKRKNPPRSELLSLFTDSEQFALQEEASSLSQYNYLKKRHLLIELRREQYTLKDSYSVAHQRRTPVSYAPAPDLILNFAPLGLAEGSRAALFPDDYSAPTVAFPPITGENLIDFRNPEDLRNLLSEYQNLSDAKELQSLFRTLTYYLNFAHLSPIHLSIFQLKLSGFTNPQICARINPQYHKTYNPNYISTIFHQKIIPEICDAATYHYEIVSSLNAPNKWKKCTGCGRTLLLSTRNFTHKAKSSDGFQSRCKECEKKRRSE